MQSKVKLTFQKHFENTRNEWGAPSAPPENPPIRVSFLRLEKFQSLIYCYSLFDPKVSPSGKRKVIAVGSLDLSEYIKEEPTSHDITVTLRPVKKSILSGSLQFILSSIMLEDGIPR